MAGYSWKYILSFYSKYDLLLFFKRNIGDLRRWQGLPEVPGAYNRHPSGAHSSSIQRTTFHKASFEVRGTLKIAKRPHGTAQKRFKRSKSTLEWHAEKGENQEQLLFICSKPGTKPPTSHPSLRSKNVAWEVRRDVQNVQKAWVVEPGPSLVEFVLQVDPARGFPC